MKNKTAAIVLSGCGVFDGSEIHEAVITLLNLQKLGAKTAFFAPDIPQSDTVNHADGSPESGVRSVLAESARIARKTSTFSFSPAASARRKTFRTSRSGARTCR